MIFEIAVLSFLVTSIRYHMQEAGANATLELAFTLADGLEVRTASLRLRKCPPSDIS
jgi:methylmalonyl-CoA mutase N-terminal domain/subunit